LKKIFFILLWCCICQAEFNPNVQIKSSFEQLILRLASVYKIDLPVNYYSRPLNYQSIVFLKKQVDSLKISGFLSVQDAVLADQCFHFYGLQKGLVKWSHKTDDINLKVNVNLLGDITIKNGAKDAQALRGIIAPSMAGNLNRLSFYSGIDVWTDYQSDTIFARSSYQPYDGLAYNLYGRDTDESRVRSSDIPHGGITYDTKRVHLETAIDYLRIGPSFYYPLTLSGATPPVTYAKAALNMDIISYTHIVGLLKSQKDCAKFIYVHRLEASLWKSRLHLGLNEVIINGSSTDQNLGPLNKIDISDTGQVRGVEWAYLIPFVPFKFTEHYVGDRDNAALSIDFSLRFPSRFWWYGEFFLDDMLSPWKLFSSDWGNKWAATLGFHYFGTLLDKNIMTTVEYSHVEPWVYTHFFGGSHSYTHFGQSLGSPLGPNSQAIIAASTVQITKKHSVELKFASIAKNSSVRGGTITDIFQATDENDSTRYHDSETKKFLGPGTVWISTPSIGWIWNPYGTLNINVESSIDISKQKVSSGIRLWGGVRF
jgi:hypothetical protein